MKTPILLAFIAIVIISGSCSKPNDGPTNGGLSQFMVTVLQRVPQEAIISWTASTNLGDNNDTVKYKVFINNRVVAIGLTRLRDTLRNLSGDTLYQGKVLAYTNSGDTVSAPFVLTKISEYIFFNSEEHFEAFDLYSGTRMWNKSWNIYTYDDGAPTVSNDTVFFSNRRLSVGNTVFAYQIKTGSMIWSAVPHPPGDLSLAENTNPVYFNGRILLGGKTGVIALFSNTGAIAWTYPHGNDENGTTPVCAGKKIFVAADGDLVALNEANGNPIWHFPVGRVNKRPLVIDNLIIFGTNNKMYALNQETGAIVWQRDFGFDTYEITPILETDRLIFYVRDAGLFMLNRFTGAIGWFDTGISASYITSTAGGGRYFYYDYSQNKLVAVSVTSGHVLWEKTNINSPISTGIGELVYAGGNIYCAVGITQFGAHGQLAKIDAATGSQQNRSLLGSDLIGTPTIKLNDIVYYPADHGNFR